MSNKPSKLFTPLFDELTANADFHPQVIKHLLSDNINSFKKFESALNKQKKGIVTLLNNVKNTKKKIKVKKRLHEFLTKCGVKFKSDQDYATAVNKFKKAINDHNTVKFMYEILQKERQDYIEFLKNKIDTPNSLLTQAVSSAKYNPEGRLGYIIGMLFFMTNYEGPDGAFLISESGMGGNIANPGEVAAAQSHQAAQQQIAQQLAQAQAQQPRMVTR